jgi:CRAL/TRIO domain
MLCFLLEYILENMLLPGQVENWIVLIDLAKKSLGNLSVSSLKQVLEILQSNYRCRLGVSYIVNPPKSIWMLWSCIKPFLDDTTIEKIKISNSSSSEIVALFSPSQLEEKYGGKAPNVLNYWPPLIPETLHLITSHNNFLNDKDSYALHSPIKELSINANNNLPLRVRVNSLDLNAQNSEVELQDLPNDPFGLSDTENIKENLIDFEQSFPFDKNGGKSPAKLKVGMDSIQEILIRNSIRKSQSTNLLNNDQLPELLSPVKPFDQSLQGFNTPKKSGPRPIGIILESNGRWQQCNRAICCESAYDNCSII